MSIETKIAKIMANDAPKCTLIDILFILDSFNFNKKFQVITIAGTNGKGTTVAMLEKMFVANNKKVLSHTSPHVFKFNERISLNRSPISSSQLLELLERLEELTVKYRLSYYQIAFLCVCLYSQKIVGLDYLILEVGVGGRLDAANIIEPDISAITNIDFDHCEVLGDTLDKIGLEKAAIARKQKPLFLGSKMPDSVYEYASVIEAIIYDKDYNPKTKNCFRDSYNIAMGIGDYLLKKTHITYIPMLEDIRARARFNVLKNDKENNSYVVVDVAHNPASVEYLFKLLDNKFGSKAIKYEAIFGVLATKDINTIVSIAKKHIYKWEIVDLKTFDQRALDIDNIKQVFSNHGIIRVDFNKDLGSVYLSKKDTVTVVFGSFVLAGEFIKEYEKNSF
ncbi:bifunctional folylpolyglutamate synthase/dihydrofolate synthase [Allofrancisella guangzhouensis]|uniref:Folylpolyglutamate synthase n=1 Tax=Allofrancisella guangzhouensis TaxID=594679 RepID=A0A0A8E3V3_9GAMM|nr:Mur ligase family protein [Allofrancisella guangzhouensis]AJC48594.1 folylpolyglutamate synthase [Allofrancisella guangzhouensis]MBK2027739.1 bifunctional folylpolyglutamate synthase/dihydrofolate synthase [Allofrancisella guangzhouensis]MBK2043477.1 bifunctional folylpolyglutamate synthase/dihydrofolate synthase [Allofrancisella guangzhouensis]MBK2045820.1 bifunctional folylpolyglutamate synthase/dihydrofolate synthase [Allofrancisella guangzhouensis]